MSIERKYWGVVLALAVCAVIWWLVIDAIRHVGLFG
jgi:hypothetical protein